MKNKEEKAKNGIPVEDEKLEEVAGGMRPVAEENSIMKPKLGFGIGNGDDKS